MLMLTVVEEHEVKILEINEEQIIRKLESLGASLVFDGDMNSSYYDLVNDNLRKSGKMLRIRKKENKTFVTLKVSKKNDEMKINTEHEVEVSDFETMKIIFQHLELNEFAQDFRKRRSYKLKDSTVEINKYPDIPTFLEIETESPEKLKEVVALLGFSMKDTKAWSGKDVLKYYGKT